MNDVAIFDDTQLDTIKNMYCKGLSDDDITIFMHICARTKLDPFARQIYAVPRWDGKLNKNVMSVQTGIDGYRLIAERTGKYSPGREPVFHYNDDKTLRSATAFVKKMTDDGTWHEVAATAFFGEYCQKTKDGRPTQFWLKMGHTMIAKCAEALALRKAFPGDLSGVYTEDEMKQAEIDISECQPENRSPKMVPQTPKMVPQIENSNTDSLQSIEKPLIDFKQLDELIALKKRCDPDYIAKVEVRLQQKNIENFSKLPLDMYELLMNGMAVNARKFEKQKA